MTIKRQSEFLLLTHLKVLLIFFLIHSVSGATYLIVPTVAKIGEKYKLFTEYGNDSFAVFRNRMNCKYFMPGPLLYDYFVEEKRRFRITDDSQNELAHMAFATSPHSLMYEKFEKFILECQQHGILNYLFSKYVYKKISDTEDSGPQILTMKKLSAGFLLWLGSVGIACIVFVGELVWFRFSTRNMTEKVAICKRVKNVSCLKSKRLGKKS